MNAIGVGINTLLMAGAVDWHVTEPGSPAYEAARYWDAAFSGRAAE
jgi:hypothetical protein